MNEKKITRHDIYQVASQLLTVAVEIRTKALESNRAKDYDEAGRLSGIALGYEEAFKLLKETFDL